MSLVNEGTSHGAGEYVIERAFVENSPFVPHRVLDSTGV